jgi:hypothetical protein
MQGSKVFIFCICSIISLTIHSQEEGFTSEPVKRGEYSLVAYISGGFGVYVSNAGAPSYLQPNVSNSGRAGTFRLMWHPDHLLKVGIETGHLTFYTYTFQDSVRNSGKVRLNATPLLIEWTMAVSKRLNVFAGSGVYFLTTHLDYAGKTSAKKASIGWMAAASYIHPLSENVGLGTEIKWMDPAETTDGLITAQLQLVWRFKKW